MPNEHWNRFGPGAVGIGWELALLGLHLHLVSGGMAPDESAAWSASDEGKEFMRRSNDGWCTADIAGGTPPDSARAAAAHTIAAYLGE